MQAFYRAHYRPSNAILSISATSMKRRCSIWPKSGSSRSPTGLRPRTTSVGTGPDRTAPRGRQRARPTTTVSLAFHMGGRTSPEFYIADLVSDLLAGGDSARLYTHLVRAAAVLVGERYISGDVDPGLFVFTGQLLPETAPEQAEAAFRAEIEALRTRPATDYEVEKVKNSSKPNALRQTERNEQRR